MERTWFQSMEAQIHHRTGCWVSSWLGVSGEDDHTVLLGQYMGFHSVTAKQHQHASETRRWMISKGISNGSITVCPCPARRQMPQNWKALWKTFWQDVSVHRIWWCTLQTENAANGVSACYEIEWNANQMSCIALASAMTLELHALGNNTFSHIPGSCQVDGKKIMRNQALS